MARVIPAFVIFENGDEAPKLMVAEHGADLSESITEMGLQVEEGSLNLAERKSGPNSNPDSPNSELEPSADADVGEKPKNGYRTCMSAELARPEGAEKLSQLESRGRFKEAARICSLRRAEEIEQ